MSMPAEQRQCEEVFNQIPPPPEGSAFTLEKVERVPVPHPYVVTASHITNSKGMYLDLDRAERHGSSCGWKGRDGTRCTLSYKEHTNHLTVFVRVLKRISNLKDVPGLYDYLMSIKDKAEALGVKGFAFPYLE